MADKATGVGRYTADGVFEHEVWKPGDKLTDPDGLPLVGAASYSDYSDNPDYWENVPWTKHEAVQNIALYFSRHISRTLAGGLASGTGFPFSDATPGVWTVTPTYLIDAIQVLSYEISTHHGVQIPCAGTGLNDANYTDNPLYWTNLPKTYLEAINSIAEFLYTNIGYKIPARSSSSDYIDDVTIWIQLPWNKIHAIRSIVAELSDHIGAPLANLGGFTSGMPYTDIAALWDTVPHTVDLALRSLAAEIVTELGVSITCPPFDVHIYRDDWPFDDNPLNWTNMPKGAMQAIQCMAAAVSTIIGSQLRVINPGPALVVAPATPADPGNTGDWAFDGTYLYRCVATDTWVRWVVVTLWP